MNRGLISIFSRQFLFFIIALICSCSRDDLAPVVDLSADMPIVNNLPKQSSHLYPKKTKPNIKNIRRFEAKLNSSYSRNWQWPIRGRILTHYSPFRGKKGIDIAGKKGEKVLAANAGVVAYSGNGLYGYGNLIIIKHSHHFLTAYGNNLNNFVKEGQYVKKGQIIAELGIVDRKYWGLHFEMRKSGKPVNPLIYLK